MNRFFAKRRNAKVNIQPQKPEEIPQKQSTNIFKQFKKNNGNTKIPNEEYNKRLNNIDDQINKLLNETDFSNEAMDKLYIKKQNTKNEDMSLKSEIQQINKNIEKLEQMIKDKENKMNIANNELKNTMLLFQKLDNIELKIEKNLLKNRIDRSKQCIQNNQRGLDQMKHNVIVLKNDLERDNERKIQISEEDRKIQEKINDMMISVKKQSMFLNNVRDKQLMGSEQTGGGKKGKKGKHILADVNEKFQVYKEKLSTIQRLKRLPRRVLDKIAIKIGIDPKNFKLKIELVVILSLILISRFIRLNPSEYAIIAAKIGLQAIPNNKVSKDNMFRQDINNRFDGMPITVVLRMIDNHFN